MQTTILNEILAFLFGRKYYANIVYRKGVSIIEICSYVFPSKELANKHREQIETTLTFKYLETISFRSRKVVPTLVSVPKFDE